SAVGIIPVLVEVPLILIAVIIIRAALGSWFFALAVEFFKQVVFAHLFNIHTQFSLREQLNILDDHRVVERLLVPVTIKGLHQFAKINDGLFPFLLVFQFHGLLDQALNILSV